MFYQNYLTMSNTADVTGGKPIAVESQSISGVNAINPLVAFYIHGRKREVLLVYFVPDTTRDDIILRRRIKFRTTVFFPTIKLTTQLDRENAFYRHNINRYQLKVKEN
jgi:hypothetical protein